jgi:predicted transcriptional regulator
MAHKSLPRPTDTELSILRVLWQLGPCTVRSVHESLSKIKPTGYTTVLKMMQIMVEKGLLLRNESQRSHVYAAALAEAETQRQLISHLLERAFNLTFATEGGQSA